MITFNIYVRSYNRYDHLWVQDLVEYCTYVVRESQAEKYRKAGCKSVMPIKDSDISSGADVLNWLLDNATEDVICVLDDDIRFFKYRLEKFEKVVDKRVATMEIERLAQLCYDLGIGFASGAGHTNLLYYDRPFKFVGVNDGIKIFNRKVVKSRFNPSIRFLYDDDFQMNELLHNRVILLSQYFIHEPIIDVNKGGNNDDKTGEEMLANHEFMKEKWGKYYKSPKGGGSGSLRVKR